MAGPVVSNTTPLSTLARVDALEWIPMRWGCVAVPAAVWRELGFLRDEAALRRLHAARSHGWIQVVPVSDVAEVGRFLETLDEGEAETLVLAAELDAPLVWMDEAAGRKAALQESRKVTGTAGMVAWAKRHGHIPTVRPWLERLRTTGGLFLSDAFIDQVAADCGE